MGSQLLLLGLQICEDGCKLNALGLSSDRNENMVCCDGMHRL